MSEDEDKTTEPADDAAEDYLRPDHVLADLQDLANSHGVGFPVVLTVGGMIVAGTLIGGWRYFDEMAADVENAEVINTEDTSEDVDWSRATRALARMVRHHGQRYPEPTDESQERDLRLAYVHLTQARVFQPGAGVLEMPRWRGRLVSVDGWTIGASPP